MRAISPRLGYFSPNLVQRFSQGVEKSAPFCLSLEPVRGGGSMVVRINNNLWRIQFTYPQNLNLRMSDGRQVLGLCDNNIKTIFIADNQSDYKTEHILCHEVTHAICFEYDIHLDYEMEEWLCNFMSDHIREVVEILDTILSAILKKAYIA